MKPIEVIKDILGLERTLTRDEFLQGKYNYLEKIFKKEPNKYTIFEIQPSSSVRNNQAYLLAQVITTFYRPARELVNFFFDGTFITYRSPYRCNFRIIMRANEIGFYLIVPKDKAAEVVRKAEGIYDTSITINEVKSLPQLDVTKVFCTELQYKKHSIFSLDTDRGNSYPLPSLLSAVRTLEGDDIAVFDAMLQPYQYEAWVKEAGKTYSLLDKGYTPNNNPAGVVYRAINEAMQKLRYELADLVAVTPQQKLALRKMQREEKGYKEAMRIKENLSSASKRKPDAEVLKAWLRIAVQSESRDRARATAYGIANAFADIKGDNELKRQDIPDKWAAKYAAAIYDRAPVALISRPNLVSVEEAGKFIQLPGDSLIKEFPQINSQNLREVHLPDELNQDDIPHIRIGDVTERGRVYKACFPLVPYSNIKLKEIYDALCTTSFAQGKQGSGKSEGYGTNWAYDMVKNGFTAIMIDTADGQVLRNFINSLPADYPEEKIHAINIDNKGYPIALNWNDILGRSFAAEGDAELQALEISERITARFISFINNLSNTGDFTDRMQQYVKSCMRAVTVLPSWSFLDLELALTSPSYREELLQLPEIQEQPEVVYDLNTLQEKALEGKEGEITNPILSRIKTLAGTQFMANLFYQQPKVNPDGSATLDLRKIMDNEEGGYGHVVAIQASYDAWNDDQATILGFMLDKINFNAFSRIDVDQSQRKPCLVWVDEPHKVIKNIEGALTGTAVEFRKYRVKNLFTGHSIDQMGKAAAALLQGGAQVTSYKTENLKDFTRFGHAFAPYTDAMALYEALPEKHYAINSIRLPSGKPCPAFIAHMAPPPGEVKDRSDCWKKSADKYGRPWKEVRKDIQEKRTRYQQLDIKWLEGQKEAAIAEKAAAAEALKQAKKAAAK